jgi:hypothetical protein
VRYSQAFFNYPPGGLPGKSPIPCVFRISAARGGLFAHRSFIGRIGFSEKSTFFAVFYKDQNWELLRVARAKLQIRG